MINNKIIFLINCIFIFPSLVFASDILVWQGQYYTGKTFNTGTYTFNFTVYDALTGGNICYSNTTVLTTGIWGEWKTEQYGVNSLCNDVSKDYFLDIKIDGVNQIPRKRLIIFNFLRKNVNETSLGNLILHGTLFGLSPLKLQDEISFIKSDGTITSAIYNAPREQESLLSSKFEDSLIHDIINETNDYGMQECWWDENTATMQMCISGAYLPKRATTISRSFQIVGNTTKKLINENFTMCEGNKYIDCDPDITGADLLVEDDIEAIGSIFSQENITAGYFIGNGSYLTGIYGDNSSWNESYANMIYYVKNNSLQLGTKDAFQRSQIWNFLPLSILRLGSLASDGDPTTVSSEGIVVYGENLNGNNMTSENFSYARIKPNRIGLYSSINSVADYYFRVDADSLYLKNNSWVKTFEIARQTGNINSQGNVTAYYFIGNGSLLTGILSDNSSWNENYADAKYINIISINVSCPAGSLLSGYIVNSSGIFNNCSIKDLNYYKKLATFFGKVGNGDSSAANFYMETWNTIPFETVYDLGNNWNATEYWYTIPYNGTYNANYFVRVTDGTPISVGYAITLNIYGTNEDDPNFTKWTGVANEGRSSDGRAVLNYHFTEGEKIRVLVYQDEPGNYSCSDASFQVELSSLD